MIHMETLNKYELSDKEVNGSTSEIGLVILDNYGRILIENKKRYIDIPKTTLSSKGKNEIIKTQYNKIFETDSPYFYELYKCSNYRYNNISSEKAIIDYNYAITHDLPKNSEYKFLTLNQVKSLLYSLKYDKNIEYVKDELEVLISKLGEIYKDSNVLSDFSKQNYLEHLTDSFITNKNEKDLRKKYPYINPTCIIEDTLNFIKNIRKFSLETNVDHIIVQLEEIYPITSFLNKECYNDLLIKLAKDNKEYLISIYLLKSYFNEDIKMFLDENEHYIDNLGIVKGLPQLVIYSKDLKILDKVDNFEKIKKINYRNNYYKRY